MPHVTTARHPLRRATASAAAAGLVAALALGAATAPASAATPVAGATGGAAWLERQFGPGHYIPETGSSAPDPSDTAQAVLAFAATGTHSGVVGPAMAFLRANVHHELTTSIGGKPVKSPGAIAFLLLDAHATGGTGTDFGGVDLVSTLLATMRTSGSDAGLFGAAAPTYDGAYRQGLSLAALAGAGASPSAYAPAVAWLQHQQCGSGGWEAYRADVSVPCGRRDPATYSGPDTNSTALAVEGLEAADATMRTDPFAFLLDAQDADGGWGYYGGPSDADSTAVVRQALVALHKAHSRAVVASGGTPLRALEGFQITSGPDAGALAYQPGGDGTKSANLLATEQAVPAIAGLALPIQPATVSPTSP